MVQAGKIHGHFFRLPIEHSGRGIVHIDGNIAQPHDFDIGVLDNGFSYHTRRIGKVDQPGVRCHLFNITTNVEYHRNGAQRLGKTARSGGFLANHMVTQGNTLITSTGCQSTYTELGHNKLRTTNPFATIQR